MPPITLVVSESYTVPTLNHALILVTSVVGTQDHQLYQDHQTSLPPITLVTSEPYTVPPTLNLALILVASVVNTQDHQ